MLYQAKCKAKAAFKFANFFEKTFVSRVNLRSCMRIVSFWRSICEVEIKLGFGFPMTGIGNALTNWPGLYRVSVAPDAEYNLTDCAKSIFEPNASSTALG